MFRQKYLDNTELTDQLQRWARQHVEPLRLTAKAEAGAMLLAPHRGGGRDRPSAGLGRGLHGGTTVFSPWTRGNGHERFVTLLVAGSGRVEVEFGSCRVGMQQLVLELDSA